MKLEIDHLSYSSISSWLYCGAAWKFRYLDKLPALTSSDLVFGSAFHNTVESHLANQLKPADPEHPAPGILDIWQDNWKKETTHLVEDNLVAREDINWKDETPESLCNLGIKMLSHKDVEAGLLSIKPAFNAEGAPAIETKVELRVPGVPIPIIGYIDVITVDGVPADFKTSSKSWSQDKAEGEIQTLFYLAALNQAGIDVGWKFRHYIFVKTKTPQFQVLEHTHKPSQLMWLFGMIQSVWKAIEAGVYPINPTSWKCSPDWCEYWGSCRGKWA